MQTQTKIHETLALKKKAIRLLTKAIAKIIIKFRLPRTEILTSLDEQLVLEAKKQDPTATNVHVAIRTGINRRYIPNYLKGKAPKAKPDKLATILEDLRWTAHKYYNSNKITKIGHFRTFQSICEQRAAGMLTYQAILDELIKRGNVKDLGNKIELLTLDINTESQTINYSKMTATQMNRIVDTMIFNSNAKSSDDKLVQRTIYSTQINPNDFVDLHKKIKEKTEKYKIEVTDLLISFEENVNVGTHPEYGVSFLEYKIEK